MCQILIQAENVSSMGKKKIHLRSGHLQIPEKPETS